MMLMSICWHAQVVVIYSLLKIKHRIPTFEHSNDRTV